MENLIIDMNDWISAKTAQLLPSIAKQMNDAGELFEKLTGKRDAASADQLLLNWHNDLMGSRVDEDIEAAAPVAEENEGPQEGPQEHDLNADADDLNDNELSNSLSVFRAEAPRLSNADMAAIMGDS